MQLLENNTISIDDFVLLLEDRAFVDYFNIYQSLPIFGQHVIYNFIEREFSYEPPIRKRRNYIDRIEVVRWLCTERFPGFTRSCLFIEYLLCNKLRDVDFVESEHDPADRSTFTRNVLGNALGMQMFRDSLKGTPGEKCYRCWHDLERLQRTQPGEQRQKLILFITNMYLVSGAPFELETAGKRIVFEGKLNFALIPETELQKELLKAIGDDFNVYKLDRGEAFLNLQHLLLGVLKVYWVPRYLLNLLMTIPRNLLAILKRETPYDKIALTEQRQTRCKLMFPKIYGSASTKSPTSSTKVLESTVGGEMREFKSNSLSVELELLSEMSCSVKEEEIIKPSDLLMISGGGRLEPKEEAIPSSSESSSFDFDDDEPREPEFSPTSVSVEPSYTKIPQHLNIPPSLSTYISGRKRLKTGHRVNNKVMCALAADKLAGNPLLSFLGNKGRAKEKKLLQFWSDVRRYLDSDETHRDKFGHSIKSQLAHKIFNRYLSASDGCFDVFTENMRTKICTSLTSQDDTSLLWFAQDFVTGILRGSWKAYMSAERKKFRSCVCGDKHYDRHILEYPDNMDRDSNDPLLFLNSTKSISPELFSGDYRPKSGSISASSRPWSRLSDSNSASLTDEQIMKAFEFTVILAEYGRSGVFSYKTASISDIIDVIYSDYGTLHINQLPVVRNNFLRALIHKPKIDIATLKVSRIDLLDTSTKFIRIEGEKQRTIPIVVKKDGVVIERPERPRTFAEVLNSPVHYEFFKKFMYEQKLPYPLAFWKNIEDLKEMPADRMRQNMINNILRKYFSKTAKQGSLLDCFDDIIQQIPTMSRVPITVLVCAQASVFRSMERKWFPKFLETYYSDDDLYRQESQKAFIPFQHDVKHDKTKPRKLPRKATLHLWNHVISAICRFIRSMKCSAEVQLLENYLKKQMQKQTSKSSKHDVDKHFAAAGSTTMFQSRLVLRNRLVIVEQLPMDLKFWCEVIKYVDLVDNIEKLENISIEIMDFLHQKARFIVSSYLDSDIPPRIQINLFHTTTCIKSRQLFTFRITTRRYASRSDTKINVPSDLANSIISSLQKHGPTRGLFHDALILIFPLIYYYWRQCRNEWAGRHTAAEMLAQIEKEEKARPNTPHKNEEVPDFLRIRSSQMKVTNQSLLDEGQFIINLSLNDGCTMILPLPKPVTKAEIRASMMGKSLSRNIKESSMKIGQTLLTKREGRSRELTRSKNSTRMYSLAEEGGLCSNNFNSLRGNINMLYHGVQFLLGEEAGVPSENHYLLECPLYYELFITRIIEATRSIMYCDDVSKTSQNTNGYLTTSTRLAWKRSGVMQLLENNTISIDDFVLLLEDRAFVDYFNIYQSLPIFGQHVIYNFIERDFSYEPPIRKRRQYIDRREVVRWLCTERFPGFTLSCLFIEYLLCTKLRDIDINLNENDDSADLSTFTSNVLGNAMGMHLFRDSLKGTPGEKCYKCWHDLERLQRTPPGEKRNKLFRYIKNMYLVSGAPFELETSGKYFAFEARLNFALIPEAELQNELLQAIGDGFKVYQLDSEEAFQNLQHLILGALKLYWAPRFLLNLIRTIPKRFLAVLKRETPFDRMALTEQRQTRCRLMFPNTIESVSTKSPTSPTKVLESTVGGEMREVSDTPLSVESGSSSEESCSVEENEGKIRPSDLLMISGGGRLEPKVETIPYESSTLDFGSDETREPEFSPNSVSVETKIPSYTKISSTFSIPPSLSTYISGRKRLKTGLGINNKVMCALAADKLAGSPLLSFLVHKGKAKEQKLLQFWTDLRQYLDADETHRDEFGNAIKKHLSRAIFNRYLSASSGCDDIFTENMKMKIFTSLSSQDDVSLLWFAQDFVTEVLKDSWKTYRSTDRKRFRSLVCGEKQFDRNILDYPDCIDRDSNDPLFFLNSPKCISQEMFSSDYRFKSGSTSASSRPDSRLSDSRHVSLTDEQIMKAFEFTVILAEYESNVATGKCFDASTRCRVLLTTGRTGVFSYKAASISDIIDVIYSDYGALHINQIPVVRNNFLHTLIHKPKIDIANLKVSKLVLLDTGLLGVDVEKHRTNRMVLRRDGVVIDRPERPRTFAEVLNSPTHYEFFKRFMTEQKMPHPLAFWKHIEDLKDMPADRMRQNIINNMIRKYFSKQGSLLDCTDDLMQQVPSMEIVPMSVLLCAQASVFRSMERKWYPKYLETYPTDADLDIQESKPVPAPVKQEEVKVDKIKQREKKRKRTLYLWNSFVSAISGFNKAMKDTAIVQLFEIYLKKEMNKQSSKSKLVRSFPASGSTTMFQTRVVVKNRLVIVDKLPMDLKFWCQVSKYIDQVENVEKLENISIDYMNFLYQKARAIVSYYLDSDIPPRNQINVPTDLAQTMASSLDKEGPTRGLFHDGFILIFPLLYHYWQQCQKEWLVSKTAAEILATMEQEEKARPQTPHKFEEVPDFLKIRSSQIKIITQSSIEEDQFIINFSLCDGCRMILPPPKVVPPKAERRTSIMARPSIKNVKESSMKIGQTSPRKDRGKERDKEKSKNSAKMDSLSEEDGRHSKHSLSTSPKKNASPQQDKAPLVDEIIAESSFPVRLLKMNDIVSAAIHN